MPSSKKLKVESSTVVVSPYKPGALSLWLQTSSSLGGVEPVEPPVKSGEGEDEDEDDDEEDDESEVVGSIAENTCVCASRASAEVAAAAAAASASSSSVCACCCWAAAAEDTAKDPVGAEAAGDTEPEKTLLSTLPKSVEEEEEEDERDEDAEE